MKLNKILIILLTLGIFFIFMGLSITTQNANALPSFARKYDLSCTACHTMEPKLNAFGLNFRKRGYRTPDEIGATEKTEKAKKTFLDRITDLRNVLALNATFDAVYDKPKGQSDHVSFDVGEIAIFYAGNATKNLSFFFQENLQEEGGTTSLEAGQVQYNFFFDENKYWAVRLGQIHPLQEAGAGAFDRPMGLSAPLILDAAYPSDNSFAWATNQRGIEAFYNYYDTKVSAIVTNGLDETGSGTQEGGIQDDNDNKDILLFVEHLFGNTGSSITLAGYRGHQGESGSDDSYTRAALVGNYNIPKIGLNLLAGVAYGKDDIEFAESVTSKGFFIEGDQRIKDNFYALARYDYLHPDNTIDTEHDLQQAATIAAIYAFQEHTRVTAEYQFIQDKSKDADDGRDEHIVTAELQFVF